MRHTKRLTLYQLNKEWVNRKGYRKSWNYCNQMGIAFDHMVKAIGDKPARNVKLNDLEDYQKYLYERLSPSSVRSYIKAVRSVFNWACSRSLIPSSPFDEKFEIVKSRKRDIHIYTRKELEAMFAVTTNTRVQAIIMAAYETGMRIGEIQNVTFDDIEDGVIHVRSKKKTKFTWAWEPKNGEERDVPMTQTLNGYIIRLQLELPVNQPYPFLSEKTYNKLLRKGELPERTRKSPDSAWPCIFRRIKKRAGIKKGVFHDFRVTRLSLWSHVLSPQDHKELSGHKDFETTMRYYLVPSDNYLDVARQAI
ncbi:MAG: tyrosine-type recombinase/integrase [Sedimentisphaerales bacterium]